MSPYHPGHRHDHEQAYRPNFYDERPRSRSPHRRSSPTDYSRGRSPRSYRDRSRDRQYSSRSRSRKRSRSRSYGDPHERPSSRGIPSKEIMMEDIAHHITEKDILRELQEHYRVSQLDDVRIIRDRQTRQSRGFGFLRFPTLEDAERFMDDNYPTIYIYGESKSGQSARNAKVHLAYGKERKDNNERPHDGDWICKVCNVNNFSSRARCFRCQTLKPDPSTMVKASNVGDNDASTDNVPSQFLLFRGLEGSTSEELFAKGVAKLNKPSNSTSQHPSNTKKSKVASTTGDSNLGAKEGTLRRVLLVRDRHTNESWRYGFAEYASIEDAQAALIRFNSFDRFTIASKQILVSYIHAGVFIPVRDSSPATERFTFSPVGNPSIKLAYWDEEAYVTELSVHLPEPTQVQSKNPVIAQQAEKEGLKNYSDIEKAKKRKAQQESNTPASTKKVAASHLQFWSNRHAELHGIKQGKPGEANSEGDDEIHPAKSYADPERNCCYLCMRQFTSTAEVNKHERLSQLHRTNLKDELKVAKAQHKLEKHGINHDLKDSDDSVQASTEYRDRARERRKVYGVVNKKGEQVGNVKKPIFDESDEEPQPTVTSKGASLLSKMGYTPGAGLGANGGGMTAPISQDVYMAGVGLGAQGGKMGDAMIEAERNTKGDYGAFAEQTRDKARERYSRM